VRFAATNTGLDGGEKLGWTDKLGYTAVAISWAEQR
jgi:hypothetical protein